MAALEHRLAAILAADVVGYSRMMAADEEAALDRLKRCLADLIEPTIAAHRGRLFKTTGDGLLVQFDSAIDALRCAVAWQRGMAGRELELSDDRRMMFRIGINLGDVILEGSDVLGDGVNVAARLEALADPGGILVAGSLHEQVLGKSDVTFLDRGEQLLKNMPRAVRTFAVELSGGEVRKVAPSITQAPLTRASRPSFAAETHNHLPLRSGHQDHPVHQPADDRRSEGPKPVDEPSIAVLPFANLSGDPEQDFLADGITEDVITALARLRWLFVIARNSSFVYKGKPVDVRLVARDLGVRYVLEGSVRTAGERIRVTGQLIDAETGKHIWAEKYDRDVQDIFAVQDDITERVVAAVEPHLYAEEGFRASSKQPDSIDAWGQVVRALSLLNKVARNQNETAQALLRRAIAMEPSYARAHALLSWAIWWAALCYWHVDTREGYRQAAAHARNALSFDPGDPWARMVSGLCLSTAGHHDRALGELRTALNLNPSFALGHTALGWALLRAGHFDEAILETGRALRMSPLDSFSGFYTVIHGLALLGARRFEEALPFLRASVAAFAEYSGHYNTLISCCGHLGLVEEAHEFIAVRNAIGPPLRLGVLRRNLAKFAHCDVFVEGLRKVGVRSEARVAGGGAVLASGDRDTGRAFLGCQGREKSGAVPSRRHDPRDRADHDNTW